METALIYASMYTTLAIGGYLVTPAILEFLRGNRK